MNQVEYALVDALGSFLDQPSQATGEVFQRSWAGLSDVQKETYRACLINMLDQDLSRGGETKAPNDQGQGERAGAAGTRSPAP